METFSSSWYRISDNDFWTHVGSFKSSSVCLSVHPSEKLSLYTLFLLPTPFLTRGSVSTKFRKNEAESTLSLKISKKSAFLAENGKIGQNIRIQDQKLLLSGLFFASLKLKKKNLKNRFCSNWRSYLVHVFFYKKHLISAQARFS